MRRPIALLAAVVLPLALVPGWSGEERLKLVKPDATMTASRVAIDPSGRRKIGGLTFLGGVALDSPDRAFGGYSALHVDGDAFTLLSDAGNLLRFRMGRDWRPRDVRFSYLPSGPRTGWEKRDRDSESMTRDPATGRWWVGFESINELWRYDAGFTRAEAKVRPPAMRRWQTDGGAEAFARLADGRFVAISEQRPKKRPMREGLVWSADPTARSPAFSFSYRPMRGFEPTDMAELPDGRLVVLERRFALPFRWSARVVLVPRGALQPGAIVEGQEVARIAAPLLTDNYEGIAVARERGERAGATILWIVSDDNELFLQRTLLLKFRLER